MSNLTKNQERTMSELYRLVLQMNADELPTAVAARQISPPELLHTCEEFQIVDMLPKLRQVTEQLLELQNQLYTLECVLAPEMIEDRTLPEILRETQNATGAQRHYADSLVSFARGVLADAHMERPHTIATHFLEALTHYQTGRDAEARELQTAFDAA